MDNSQNEDFIFSKIESTCGWKNLLEYADSQNRSLGNPIVHCLKSTACEEESANGNVIHFCVGSPDKPSEEEKFLVLIGQRNSGQSTLINAMINYLAGVKFEDNVRLVIPTDLTEDISNKIFVYKIHSAYTNLNFTINIIDVPGIDDDQNGSRNKHIVSQLELYFKEELPKVDATCLVINSTIARLTDEQKYVLNTLKPFYSQAVCDKVFILATRSLTDDPVVQRTIDEFGLKFNKLFCFENGWLLTNQASSEKKRKKQKQYYEDAQESFLNFFNWLQVENQENEKTTQSDAVQDILKLDERTRKENCSENIVKSLTDMETKSKICGERLVQINNFELLKSIGNWSVYHLPLMHTNISDQDSVMKKIKILETVNPVNPQDSESIAILIIGSTSEKRILTEYILNNTHGIRPCEKIWLTPFSDNQESENLNWLVVYKLHFAHGERMNFVVNIVDIPDTNEKNANSIKLLAQQLKFLFSKNILTKKIAICYIADEESPKPPVLSLLSSDMADNTIVFSLNNSGENVSSLSECRNRRLIPKNISESILDDDVKEGFISIEKVFQISYFDKAIEKSMKIVNLYLSKFETIETIQSYNEILNILNEDTNKYKSRKEQQPSSHSFVLSQEKPNNSVINCTFCNRTCCDLNHHDKSWGFWGCYNKEPCPKIVNEVCTQCECPQTSHEKSKHVKYVFIANTVTEYSETQNLRKANINEGIQNVEKDLKLEKKKLSTIEDNLRRESAMSIISYETTL